MTVTDADPSDGADPSSRYLAEADSAQRLLDEGKVDAAMEAFAALLADLGEEPTFSRAAVLERIGRCALMQGQPIVAATVFQQAMEQTEKLALSDGVKGLQGVLQSGLGDAFHAAGRLGDARKSYEAALILAEDLKDARAQGVDLDHLGTLALKEGHPAEAVERFQSALGVFRELREPASEAVTHFHLGAALHQTGQWDEAEQHYIEAARIMEERGDFAALARARSQLAAVSEKSGRMAVAEGWHRKALEAGRSSRNPAEIRRQLVNLARFLLDGTQNIGEARQLAEEALAATRTIVSLDPDVWGTYGLLADVLEKETAGVSHQAQAQSYRHIQDLGPRLQITLVSASGEPSFGSAVIMERLGRCCLMGGRMPLAVALFRKAIEVAAQLPPSEPAKGLEGVLRSSLGEALGLSGRIDDAQRMHEAALKIAEDLKDRRGQAAELGHLSLLDLARGQGDEALTRLEGALEFFEELHEQASVAITKYYIGMAHEQAQRWQDARRAYLDSARIRQELGDSAGAAQSISLAERAAERSDAPGATDVSAAQDVRSDEKAEIADPSTVAITLYEELTTECVLGTDLLIDVRRETRITPCPRPVAHPLDQSICPVLAPRTRSAVDEKGALRFYLAPGEPEFVHDPHSLIMRHARREIAISGDLAAVWKVVRLLDGARAIESILAAVPDEERGLATDLIGILAETGALDISGRPMGRFLHRATKKGVLPGGGLQSDEVLRLATDGEYRTYPDAPRIALADAVPDPLHNFHVLTRARRSRRDYSGEPLERQAFDALLHTACGVTGSMPWTGREVKLRAYPSSGALYAVEIYPVVFRVEGLEPGVYHYAAGENGLDVLNPDAGSAYFVEAALPVERTMVSGAATMICLVGRFRRHERKYGEGGYRMMVAEAGHISQNLVLTAVAMGLAARPFGGVFDALVNQGLGLDEEQEQFLLSVLVGHADAKS